MKILQINSSARSAGANSTRLADAITARLKAANPAAAPSEMLMDYHVPLFSGADYIGDLVATYKTSALLDEMVPWWFAQDNQISLIDRDDKVLARRAAAGPGHGVYTHKRALDVPGATIILFTDSVKSQPKLLPNLLVGSVIALSLGLLWSLLALWRHISRRLVAEGALRQHAVEHAQRACRFGGKTRDGKGLRLGGEALEEAGLALNAVQVVAQRRTDTELSMLKSVRSSLQVVSGISSQQIPQAFYAVGILFCKQLIS